MIRRAECRCVGRGQGGKRAARLVHPLRDGGDQRVATGGGQRGGHLWASGGKRGGGHGERARFTGSQTLLQQLDALGLGLNGQHEQALDPG